MLRVNWWITSSFWGRRPRRTSPDSQRATELTSCAPTEPIAWPGIWPSSIRHSGSSARLTSGSASHRRSALASVRKSDRPGWMSSTRIASTLRAARR